MDKRMILVITAALLLGAAAPALAVDDLRLMSLTPPSGTLAGVRDMTTPLSTTNSVEAAISYRLQSAAPGNRGIVAIHGYPMVPPTYPTAMSPAPNIVSAGQGRIRVRFSLLCAPTTPPSVALTQVRYFLGEVDASGRLVRMLVERYQTVNYTFICAHPTMKPRPGVTPGIPQERVLPGPLPMPDLVVTLNTPMTDTIVVRNIGTGKAQPSQLSVTCSPAKSCPQTVFPFLGASGPSVLMYIGEIMPGASYTTRVPSWPRAWPVSGTISFLAVADYPRTISEINEDNNTATSSLAVP